MAAQPAEPRLPIGGYYTVVSKLARFLRFLYWGLAAAFAVWVAARMLTHADLLMNAPSPVLGVEAFVKATVVPLLWLLAVIFAVKILAEIFEAEARAVEEHIREMLLGELLLRGRLRLDYAARRYGFTEAMAVARLLLEAARSHGISVRFDEMVNEAYLA